MISYIENLESLKQLRDLNLAENRIKKIENIVELLLESFSKLLKEMLTNLEKLNLNGNHIKYIPDVIFVLFLIFLPENSFLIKNQ